MDRLDKVVRKLRQIQPSYTQWIALGFVTVIIITALLLMLPVSSAAGQYTEPLTALFTATSAVCVTGLVVVDTATYWSVFGQCVILVAIQIGGLGLMTIVAQVMLTLRRRISLAERSLLMESVSSFAIGDIVRMARRICVGTAIIEIAGALVLSTRFVPLFGIRRGVYYSVFHSVSAFCNAGFDLMGAHYGAFSSLTAFVNDPVVNITICVLVLLGGLGFFVWDDLIERYLHRRKIQLHTKLVLLMTASLVLVPTALFFLSEQTHTFAGLSSFEKLLAALFSAVTPRTAGFNTVDTAALSDGSILLTLLLMLIGGNPGSTAGGMKTTTLLTVLLGARAMLYGRTDVNVLGRRIEPETLRRASCVATIYLSLCIVASLAILCMQPELALRDVLVEVFSAVNTVGMSTGVTRSLGTSARLLLIGLMFCGRMGSLTFALLFIPRKKTPHVQRPIGKIMVG